MEVGRQLGVRVVVIALACAAAAVFLPLWAPLVLAAWIADLVRPLQRRLERVLYGRAAAAGVLLVTSVIVVGAPIGATVAFLAGRLRELLSVSMRSGSVGAALRDLFGSGESVEPPAPRPRQWLELAREHGAAAWRVLSNVSSASATAFVGVMAFGVAVFALMVHGPRLYAWLARHLPLNARARWRLVGAFRETGRGLLVGTGGTALLQGALSTIAYAVLDVRNPGALGLLTAVASIFPALGTAAVWIPVAVALALAGHVVRAAFLGAIGFCVIATADNVVRPWLSRLGRLRLPASVVFLSMLGGIELVGTSGLILGPLLVRVGVEALAIARAERPGSGAALARSHSRSWGPALLAEPASRPGHCTKHERNQTYQDPRVSGA